MDDWQVVPRRNTVNGIQFRMKRGGKKLTVYIGAGTTKRIKDYKPYSWCEVYKRGYELMIQMLSKPGETSRKVSRSVFSLPHKLVLKYWPDGGRNIDVPVKVENSLILVDLRDLYG